MRHGLTASILLAGALVLAGACSADREPTAPAAAPALSVASTHDALPADLDRQIEKLIVQLFPKSVIFAAAIVRFEGIEFLVRKGKTAAAQKQALDLVAFTLEKYNGHRLIGDQSPRTQMKLQSFIDLLYQFVGLGHAPIPPGALGEDGAVALVGTSGGTVVTGSALAGVQFPTNALTQTVIVAVSPTDQTLPTDLRQFPPTYDFKTFPEVPVFGQAVTVGLCVDDESLGDVDPDNLRLAHPLHSDPSVIEILPKVTELPFTLNCGGFGARKSRPTNLASVGRNAAEGLLWLMMGAPRDLSATESRRMMMPGGLGGRTSSFSPFSAVEFTGTLVPYQDSGYRYLQLGQGFAPPTDFNLPSFVDTGWSIGAAAFGTGSCSLSSTIQTAWPAASPSVVTNPAQFTSILLRKTFDVPAGVGHVTVGVAIDNDVQVFVNGVNITASSDTDATGFLRHEDCPTLDSFILTVPDTVLHAGTNLVVVRARDRGVQSFIDIRVKGVLQGE